MKINFWGEIIITLALLVLLSFFINPLQLAMPLAMHVLMVPVIILLLIILLAAFWKEMPHDEREQYHTLLASRFSYFAAVTTLVIAIVVENTQHAVDPWLVIVISIILVAKLCGRIFGILKK